MLECHVTASSSEVFPFFNMTPIMTPVLQYFILASKTYNSTGCSCKFLNGQPPGKKIHSQQNIKQQIKLLYIHKVNSFCQNQFCP